MNNSNAYPAFGSLFAMGATLVSPMHEAITSKPLYDGVAPRAKPPLIWTLIAGVGATLDAWRRRRAQRVHLAHLSDQLLQDIGITRHQLEEEARKPFWRS